MTLSIDTTVTAGATMRVSERSCEHVSPGNGGCVQSDGVGNSMNSDNGNLNFGKGDITSAVVKATMDIQGTWENYGFFVRPTAFYDHIYHQNDMDFYDLTPTAQGVGESDIRVLDAYVYGSFDVAGMPTTIRFGKQVLNWGESMFIQGGVNSFQAADVTALRSPGSELREGYTPMPMVMVQTSLTPDLSLEAFWQFSYSITRLDPAGSFFSTDDIAGPGSLPAILNANFDDPNNCVADGDTNILAYANPASNPICLSRTADRGQDDTDQYGVAMHYYAADVGNGIDFGLYYVRFSSRLPYLGFTNGKDDITSACATVLAGTLGGYDCFGGPNQADAVNLAFAYAANQSTYFYDFPTVDTIGASFSTTLGVTAVAGELTFSPKMPFGISDSAMNASQIDGLGGTPLLTGGGSTSISEGIYEPGVNESTWTHIDLDAYQGQFSTINSWSSTDLIPSLFDADSGLFLFNAGFVYVPDADKYPLNRPGPEGGYYDPFGAAILQGSFTATNAQYATTFSSGYRMRLAVDYNNAFGTPFTVTPSISWRQDLSGWSPGPNTANYQRGTKQVGLGLDVGYQSAWRGSIVYVNTFSNDWTVAMTDRDFVQASISYAF